MKQRLFNGLAIGALALCGLMPVSAMAAEFVAADESGSVSISKEINNDIYAVGGSVAATSPISGDAFFAGGNVLVSGDVGESVMAAGGTITIVGNVAGDLRVIGGNITLNGKVAKDLIVLGGQVVISSSASIGGDLVILGGAVLVDAPVSGDVYINAGEVKIDSAIGGSAKITAEKITYSPSTTVGGALIYSALKESQIANEAVGGGIEFTKTETKTRNKSQFNPLAMFVSVGLLVKLIATFVLALVLVAIFKKRSIALTQAAFSRFGTNLLYGFAAIVLVPIAALTVLITIIGAPLSLIAFAAYGILLSLAGILAPILVGSLIWKKVKKTANYPVNTYSILVGSVVYILVALIPLIGWIFCALFMLVALGVLSRSVINGIKLSQK